MEKKPIFCGLKPAREEAPIRRNHNCPEYDGCLSIAAFADLDLDCSVCSLKNVSQPCSMISELEIIGCSSLIKTVFIAKEKVRHAI